MTDFMMNRVGFRCMKKGGGFYRICFSGPGYEQKIKNSSIRTYSNLFIIFLLAVLVFRSLLGI